MYEEFVTICRKCGGIIGNQDEAAIFHECSCHQTPEEKRIKKLIDSAMGKYLYKEASMTPQRQLRRR